MKLELLKAMNAARRDRRACALVTRLANGEQRFVAAETTAGDPLAEPLEAALRAGKSATFEHGGESWFLTIQVPPVRVVMIGAVHISQALAPLARIAGLDPSIIDPRTAFATPERFPDTPVLAQWPDEALEAAPLDRYTAICLLTHDPKIDDRALVRALRADCFYIGALGSRKTHAKRLERMRAAGFDEPALARIHAPIGLDIGAVSPAEIAVSITGEIIAALRKKPLRSERGGCVKFGPTPVAEAEGAVLAHALRLGELTLKKGHVIAPTDQVALRAAGVEWVVAARIEPGDVAEDEAAQRLAECIAGENLRRERPFTGRVNIFSTVNGLTMVDPDAIERINRMDEAITVATLAAHRPVVAGDMAATVKIIPFAAPGAALTAACQAVGPRGAVWVAPYRPLRLGIVSTLLPGLKTSVVVKTLRILEARLAPSGATIAREERVAHEERALAAAIDRIAPDCEALVIFGASAITDRRDVIPRAIETSGGRIEHFGMPVDPGNLLLLAERFGMPIIGAPGCARSPKENGFDWVLNRILAGVPITSADIKAMGVGGLLMEIASRPQPRLGDD